MNSPRQPLGSSMPGKHVRTTKRGSFEPRLAVQRQSRSDRPALETIVGPVQTPVASREVNQGVVQQIHLRLGVVHPEGGSHRAYQLQLVGQRDGAMHAGAQGDSELIRAVADV